MRLQIAKDVPPWSELIPQESERIGYPYIDTVNNFPKRLAQADSILTTLVLSARAYHRTRSVKLARTIADLAGSEDILSVQLAEVLQDRGRARMQSHPHLERRSSPAFLL